VTGTGLGEDRARTTRFGGHLFGPLGPLGVGDHDGHGRTQRATVADPPEEGDLIGLESHAGPPPVAQPPPRQLASDIGSLHRQAGRQPLDRNHEGATVRLARSEIAQHALTLVDGYGSSGLGVDAELPAKARRLPAMAKALPSTRRISQRANIEGVDADAVIAALGLSPHPEGGHYRQTWADAASSAIYFLLRDGERSAWHRVRDRAEVWHFYAGGPLELRINGWGPDDEETRSTLLGPDLAAGQRPQAVVPAGAWQCAQTLGAWSLVGCTVAPPFTFAAFDLAPGRSAP
jgi:uncharacterized protein